MHLDVINTNEENKLWSVVINAAKNTQNIHDAQKHQLKIIVHTPLIIMQIMCIFYNNSNIIINLKL